MSGVPTDTDSQAGQVSGEITNEPRTQTERVLEAHLPIVSGPLMNYTTNVITLFGHK